VILGDRCSVPRQLQLVTCRDLPSILGLVPGGSDKLCSACFPPTCIPRSHTSWRPPISLATMARSRILLLPRLSPHRQPPSSPLPEYLQEPHRNRPNKKAMTMTRTRTLTNLTVRPPLYPSSDQSPYLHYNRRVG